MKKYESGWNLRGVLSPAADERLQIYLTGFHLPSNSLLNDEFYWLIDYVELPKFSTRKT